jgi:hypothetical protein
MQVEVSCVGTLSKEDVPAARALLAERSGTPGRTQTTWVRTYRSRVTADKRGLGELHVLSDAAGNLLRAEATESLAIAQYVVQRSQPCLQARRVSLVTAKDGIPEFVAALGFQLSHESLRRGHSFQQDAASISLFELCGRQGIESSNVAAGGAGGEGPMELDGADASIEEGLWKPVSGDVWLLEIVVRGDQLKSLAEATDFWADTLSALPTFVLQPATSVGGMRKPI